MWQFQTSYKSTVRQALSPVLRNMRVQDKQFCPLGDESLVWFKSVNVHISRAFAMGGHTGLPSNLELKKKVYNLMALWGNLCILYSFLSPPCICSHLQWTDLRVLTQVDLWPLYQCCWLLHFHELAFLICFFKLVSIRWKWQYRQLLEFQY